MTDLLTGMMWSTGHPSWKRDYYALLLLETLRTKSIMVPYCAVKRDYAGANSGVVVYTEIYDSEPDWNPITESTIWLQGAHLDSRTVQIQLEIHGDVLKFSDYSEVVQYVNRGDIRGLVKNKIGVNQKDYLDILARNAFLAHPDKIFAGSKANRAALTSSDLFDPDLGEIVRVHLEENEVPGAVAVTDADIATLVCTTTPRVMKDIRTGGTSKWLEVHEYAGPIRKFNGEVGTWAGFRFVRSNRLRLRNHGTAANQTTLNGATVVGQGAKQTVDTVYTVGQAGSTRYVDVADASGFTVGQYVTIHAVGLGTTVLETDGTQETRRIVEIETGGANERLIFNKPLMKPHANGDYVTNGVDIHTAIFHGGPSVVYGIGEDPHYIEPPTYDDLMIVNRYGWRGFVKFQMFRPEFFEVVESAGSTD